VIDAGRLPASSAVQVAALFRPELFVEIEAFALVGEEDQPVV
jgi:enamine deaminase RidA (YjgF/YER057c/UK114 family)